MLNSFKTDIRFVVVFRVNILQFMFFSAVLIVLIEQVMFSKRFVIKVAFFMHEKALKS